MDHRSPHSHLRAAAALALVFASAPALAVEAQQEKQELKKVRLSLRATGDRIEGAKFGRLVDDYGSYVVLSVPAGALQTMRRSGMDVEPLAENIGLGAFVFDPAEGAPPLPPRLRDHEDGPEPRYYLVQFRGPIREEWLAELKRSGVEPIHYAPDNAMVVRATPPQIAAATRGPEVRWRDLFHPAYKLSDDLAWLLGRPVRRIQAGRQRYRVGVFKTGATDRLIAAIAAFGGRVDRVPDVPGLYFHTLLVELDTARLEELAALREVCRVETWSPDRRLDERANQIVAGTVPGSVPPSPGYASFLTARGIDGSGITVGVVDDGVDVSEGHLAGRVTDNATIRRGAPAGAEGHGHHDAAIIAGQCTHTDPDGFQWGGGVAPQAHILNLPMLRAGYSSDDAQAQVDIVETTAGNGERGTVSNNSWGSVFYNNAYGAREALYDALVHDASASLAGLQPLAIVFAAGNSGPSNGSINQSPHPAKNILLVGASENYRPALSGQSTCGTVNADNADEIACFSSRGPTADNRIRPDITAPGTWIASALAGSTTLWGDIDASHRYSSGTSQAAPHAAGATALIQQWWKSTHDGALPAPALSKAMLINGATDGSAGTYGSVPNTAEGWGRLNLANVIGTGVPTIYDNQEHVLGTTGQTFSLGGNVAGNAAPFRVTLVWSDAPGAAGANPSLVNNLDLEVTAGGNTFKGNVFADGVSVTGGERDTRNNVEAVYFPPGAVSGSFVVTVRATSLNGDGALGNADASDQHFALVVFNGTPCALPAPTASAAPNGDDRIDVTWSTVAGATSYRVLRATSPGGPFTDLGIASIAPFADTTVEPFTEYFYVVRSIGSCESGDSAAAAATSLGTIAAPETVAAIRTGPTTALLTWSTVRGASGYRIYRTSNQSTYTALGTSGTTSFADGTPSVNTAYLYKVRAIDAIARESADSAKALLTTVVLTDPHATAGVAVKAAHFAELRSAVNAVRALAGAAPVTFTDASLPSVQVKRLHLLELRSALQAARASLALPQFLYLEPVITSGSTEVRFMHLKELRQATGAAMQPLPILTQILSNPGFELGDGGGWVRTPGVITDDPAIPARSGSFKARLGGGGVEQTHVLEQHLTVPGTAIAATLSFWLSVTTEDSASVPYDELRVQILNGANAALLETLATYSNVDATGTYVQKTFDLLAYKGQPITIRFLGVEDGVYATAFVIDDTSLQIARPGLP